MSKKCSAEIEWDLHDMKCFVFAAPSVLKLSPRVNQPTQSSDRFVAASLPHSLKSGIPILFQKNLPNVSYDRS
jgi:hypothetical protein